MVSLFHVSSPRAPLALLTWLGVGLFLTLVAPMVTKAFQGDHAEDSEVHWVDATLVETLESFVPVSASSAASMAASHTSGLPALGHPCKAFGAVGVCAEESACHHDTGRAYYGFCAGAASIKCCVPAVKHTAYHPPALAKITQPAAIRKQEHQHQAKWARFKSLHKKTYSSADVEHQRYVQFRINRERVIDLNDRHGKGAAIFSSTSPYMDIAAEVFTQQYKGISRQEHGYVPRQVALLETEAAGKLFN